MCSTFLCLERALFETLGTVLPLSLDGVALKHDSGRLILARACLGGQS